MAKFYRFYVTDGEDAQTAALLWADSDTEALVAGFEDISGVRYRVLAAEWGVRPTEPGEDDAFFTTSCILDDAREMGGELADNVDDLLWQYIGEMVPSMGESTRAEVVRRIRDEILRMSN
jgi:hypothetical protein